MHTCCLQDTGADLSRLLDKPERIHDVDVDAVSAQLAAAAATQAAPHAAPEANGQVPAGAIITDPVDTAVAATPQAGSGTGSVDVMPTAANTDKAQAGSGSELAGKLGEDAAAAGVAGTVAAATDGASGVGGTDVGAASRSDTKDPAPASPTAGVDGSTANSASAPISVEGDSGRHRKRSRKRDSGGMSSGASDQQAATGGGVAATASSSPAQRLYKTMRS